MEAALYAALALGTILPAIGSPTFVPGDGVDLYGTLWFYWWIADCVANLRDPSWTNLFFWPYGKDIFAHTGNNFVDAVLAAPLQAVFGNPAYYKWWVFVLCIGNALSFRVLARAEIADRWAAMWATALWMVNPYLVFELTCGRPTQAFAWFVPIALWALLRVGRSWRMAVTCGVAFALVGWSYWFYAYFLGFVALWLCGLEAIRYGRGRPSPEHVGVTFRLWLARLGLAAVTALVLVLPAVVPMIRRAGEGAIPGIGGAVGQPIHTGVIGALNGYLLTEPYGPVFFHHLPWGLALIVWLIAGPGRARWGGVVILALSIAVGTVANLFGTEVPVPWYLWLQDAVPFFNRLWFPYRILVIAFLATSLGMGFLWVRVRDALTARLGARGAWRAATALAAVALAGTLVSERATETWPLVVRDVRMPRAYTWMAQHGGAIIDLPRGIAQNFIVWQTGHGLPLLGGMGENVSMFWPEGYKQWTRNRFLGSISRVCRDPRAVVRYDDTDKQRMIDRGFRWVLLHRELLDSEFNRGAVKIGPGDVEQLPFLVQDRLVEMLGPPDAVEGPLVVWSLVEVAPPPADLAPTAETLHARSWQRPEPLPYEARLYELGRLK